MSRKGGSANLSGVQYQQLYTASRFAHAIVTDEVATLRPEEHKYLLPRPAIGDSSSKSPQPSAIDDLVIYYKDASVEYVSLKYRDGKGSWDAAELRDRHILADFFNQYQFDNDATLLLVSQTPIDRDLEDCIERAHSSDLATLAADMGHGPMKAFEIIATYLKETFKASLDDTIRFLQRVSLRVESAYLIEENLMLRLQPRVEDVEAVKNSLIVLALQAGAGQRTLTPEAIRQELLRQGHPLVVSPNQAAVLEQLHQTSSSLANEPATIGQLPPHHIVRPEVTQLVDWILSPLLPLDEPQLTSAKQKSKILIGGAGVGKTVLLRDVYFALREHHLPVLGLKADRVKGNTKGELLTQIQAAGLHYPLLQALASVASVERPAVVLIDQLDALSLCLSADPRPLRSYTELLNELYKLSHVRLVLSCRTFDLTYDPDLAPFQQAQRVELSPLSYAQVKETLQATAVHKDFSSLSPALLDLLRVPLHLALYCALDDEARFGASITSVQELYHLLFDHYLVSRKRLPITIETTRVKHYLTQLAEAMYTAQTLTLPAFRYQEQDKEVCDYLCSRGVLALTSQRPQQLSFFHQTFFEYLFARQFVLSDQSLDNFVLASNQGLFQRSLIQQVLLYLRNENPISYATALEQLLTSPHCRFHIKLLLLQHVASQLSPTVSERELVAHLILPDKVLQLPFIEAARTKEWVTWLAASPVFEALVPTLTVLNEAHIGRALFWNLVNQMPAVALQHISSFPVSPHRSEWIIWLLGSLKQFNIPLFIPLFDATFVRPLSAAQQFRFWHILVDATESLPDWTATKVYQELALWPTPHGHNAHQDDHIQAEIVEKLYETAPAVGVKLSNKLLRTWIKQENRYREFAKWDQSRKYLLFPQPFFLERRYRESDTPHNAPEAICHYLRKHILDPTQWQAEPYRQLIRKWANSRTKVLVELALIAISTHPTDFREDAIKLFTKLGWFTTVAYTYLGYLTSQILPAIWDSATYEQRMALAATLSSRSVLVDEEVYEHSGRRIRRNNFGKAVLPYLVALTPARLISFPALLQLSQQLQRRWTKVPLYKPSAREKVTQVSDPSPALSWKVEVLGSSNWLQALRKYRKKEDRFWEEAGTYKGLCRHLAELVKANPVGYVPLLKYLIEHQDESVPRLLSALNEVSPEVASPLIEQAHQRHLLTGEAVQNLRRTAIAKITGKKPEVDPDEIRKNLTVIRANLDSSTTVSGDGITLLMAGLNSKGGNAAYHILSETIPASVLPEVLATLQLVAAEGSRYVRAGAVHYLAMLLNAKVSPQQTLSLLSDLVGTDYALFEPGLWSLQYLIWRDYEAVLALLKQAMSCPQAYKPITQLLTVAWGHQQPGARELLNTLWEVDPELRATSLELLMDGYEHGNWPDKHIFYEGFTLFLTPAPGEKLRRAYDSTFIHLPAEDFNLIFPLIGSYLEVCATEFDRDHFLIEYLAKSVHNYPAQCVEVLQVLFNQIPVDQTYWPAKKGLEILIEAYTSLSHQGMNNQGSKKALDLFDHLLSRPDCRNDLGEVLNQVQTVK
ncbi:NACHT domain-containing protein [Hymenobacter crusticola]|uniref:NACHT domain-containing protein n=1 Tax=Hymenobacter crusticola TaxID=1770526 RepID=A0A243W7P2_9BACT|nr:NACHT domain-containing protein [Hymenobacter crusticola]OUJ69486.1 hypothetical protein BXP70_26235 [Hymenobacter crusticola]